MTGLVKHSAPGPYLGFALQPVRLCYHLLSSPLDSSVSLEVLDDVAVHFADGNVLLEQCKSALSHNALSDWSEDLWKTLANWLALLASTEIDAAKTSFQLYVTPQRAGKLSSAMHEAADQQAIHAFVKQIEKKLKARPQPPKCIAYVEKFLDASEAHRYAVISRFSAVSVDNDPIEPLRALLTPAVPTASIDVICQSAIGIAKDWADQRIRKGMPALISVAEFRKNFHAFVQRNNLPGYLPTFSVPPTPADAKSVLASRPVFIRQLQLIQATEEQQLRAASDFMRTSGDKAKWADQGLVFDGSFDDWEDSLVRRHAAIQSEVKDLHSHKTEIVQGRTVYNRCSTLDVPLDSRALPGHFTHGGFNDLADRRKLGWHSNHTMLLDKEDEQ
ncbi:ABC-three component system protein [Variovorax sp. KK3]|uniref:ABC-three component system protein n=1 Tax=Variovorax sp. KK3 TaxID=1855728 RepID=UPI00097BCE35|nr:ABC-three component system protein [Variovorax sp. KK3]